MRASFLVLVALTVFSCAESGSSSGDTSGPPDAGTLTPDAATDTAPAPPLKASTRVLLDLTPLSPKFGEEVTLTATVEGATPTGTVQMKDGSSNLGAPIALIAGAGAASALATFKTSTLAAGDHVVTATYAGDDDDAPSTSAATTFTITFPTTLPFNTGIDKAGVTLANGVVDLHWTIKDGAGTARTAYAQSDANGFPGIWLAPSATSKFISPFADTLDPGVGPFTYSTTFSLRTGVNLATTKLNVSYACDDAMSSITLNGQAIAGVSAGSYSSFVVLPITGPFVVGPNTISFVSSNSGGPTGFRAELDLTAN